MLDFLTLGQNGAQLLVFRKKLVFTNKLEQFQQIAFELLDDSLFTLFGSLELSSGSSP